MISERTEVHFISDTHSFYKWAIAECGRAASLWNYTNYLYRQAFTGHHDLIPEYADLIDDEKFFNAFRLIKRMRSLKVVPFYTMVKPNVGMGIVTLVGQAWKGWFAALRSYKKDPSKFKGAPKMPGYKKKEKDGGVAVVPFTYQEARLQKDGSIKIRRDITLPIRTRAKAIQQVRFVPVVGGINIEVIYRKEIQESKLDKTRCLGVDLGVNNLMSVTSNIEASSMLVNGRQLKSINRYFNKEMAHVQSTLAQQGLKTSRKLRYLQRKRNHAVKDYMHKASRLLVDYAAANNIGLIVIGYNPWWKDEVNLGAKNNQNFVHIPHAKLTKLVRYKFEELGGEVREVNESHTSKCSFLDGEETCHHESYVGERVKRGLFRSACGKAINADLNGAANILKRGIKASWVPNETFFHPRLIDVEKSLRDKMYHPSQKVGSSGVLATPKPSNGLEC